MDSVNNTSDSYVDLLNESSPNEYTPSPNNPQNPNFPQNPNYPPYPPHTNYPPRYGNYPPPPNYPPHYRNYPPPPNYPPQPNYPPHSNYPPYPNYQQFPPQPNAPVRPDAPPVDVEEDDGPGSRRLWAQKEEEVLFGAFLTASNDPVVGNNQKADSFWKRVVVYFNTHSGYPRRGLKQCKNKYHALNGKVTKFAGFYNNRASHWQSGASDEQILADAQGDYRSANNGKPFTHLHIWRMVKDEPKWQQQPSFEARYQHGGFQDSYQTAKKTRVNESGDYTSSEAPETPASQAESNNEFPTQPLDSEDTSHDPPPPVRRTRPMGQKAAKRKGKGKVGESSQSTARDDELAEFCQGLQLQMREHNELQRRKVEVRESRAKDKAFFKLCELRKQNTSGMTPEELENHMQMMTYIREKYGF